MIRIVGLTGPARSGKDTVASLLWEHFDVYPIGFTDALKEAASVLLHRPIEHMEGEDGFDREAILPEWGFSVRYFLQTLGTEGMRHLFREDFWINRIKVEIAGKDLVVVTDMRYEDEADFIRENGGVVWHVERPDSNGLGEEAQAHASEAGIEFKYGDVRLLNDGTLDQLENKVVFAWTQLE